MRIVHITTSLNRGGAATAMLNLHTGLLEAGIESDIIALESDFETSDRQHIINDRTISSERELIQLAEAYYTSPPNRTLISNTHFSLNIDVSLNLGSLPLVQAADIIHLHWTAGFLSTLSILSLAGTGKPMFWTLHDIRPISGGCHFPADCEGYTAECNRCPQLTTDPLEVVNKAHLALRKLSALTDIHYIAPSSWMFRCLESSSVALGKNVSLVPYGIDAENYRRVDKTAARAELKLKPNAQYILLGAHNLLERRKGFVETIVVLEMLKGMPILKSKVAAGLIRIATFGSGANEIKGWHVDHLGFLKSTELVCAAYSACDLLLFTPQEDNLPNVVMEAMACELPIAALNVGGIPDLVVAGQTGILFDRSSFDIGALRVGEALLQPSDLSRMGQRARKRVTQLFSINTQADTMIGLYETCIRSQGRVNPTRFSISSLECNDVKPLNIAVLLSLAIKDNARKLREHCADFIKKCQKQPWRIYGRRARKLLGSAVNTFFW